MAKEEEESVLNMSDEDMMEMEPPSEESEEEEEDGLQEQEGEGETTPEPEEEQVEEAPTEEVSASDDTETPEEEEEQPAAEVDYEGAVKQLFTPFKANGKDMQINSIDDAITLMQMGANYNKKMAGLKPNLKLMKMLEKNELLDEDKLSFLIDLQKKDPAAIAKFMKDSEVDPLDIDMETETEYKPKTYTVDDKEVELDGVLEDIQDTDSFKDTIDIISNKWDQPSKQVLLDNPSLIPIINEHVGTGMYQEIRNIVDNERVLGKLTEMSDIEAYKHVGDVIQANGGFDQVPQTQQELQQLPATAASDPTLKSRKRAAGSTKSSPASAKADFNPLSMSDEEFEKMAGGQFV